MPRKSHLDIALEYARRWHVLPLAWVGDAGICSCRNGADCKSPGKHPLTKNGVKDATQDEATIRTWWRKWPQANIGICTGVESGITLLDVDPRNGGTESLEHLITLYGALPETLVCGTGGGGWHYYFQHPGHFQFKGKVPGYAGLDIKSNGGYVVAPPSRHHSGGIYRWLSDWRTTPIAPVPEWLLELILAQPGQQPAGRRVKRAKRQTAMPAWMTAELGPGDLDILRRLQEGMEGGNYHFLAEGAWEGLGYGSQSEADMALFNRLARLTGGDAGRMYAIFKETGLMRHEGRRNYPDYYQRTIEKAIDGLAWQPERALPDRKGTPRR
jgi:hypothetical protein